MKVVFHQKVIVMRLVFISAFYNEKECILLSFSLKLWHVKTASNLVSEQSK